MTPRANYDTSMTFEQLVRPHFFAQSEDGDLVTVQGEPDQVVMRDGKVKIRLREGRQKLYLDPLALTAGELGEHPVHRVHRLQAMGIPLDKTLREELEAPASPDRLFHTLEFEYLRDKESRGTIAEVFPDGTFLVIPFEPPKAWRSPQEGVASPTHLHVNPRALTVAGSALAQDYEDQILGMSFDRQRYPPPEVARKQCGVYREALSNAGYHETLKSIGFRFTLAHVLTPGSGGEDVFGERLSKLITPRPIKRGTRICATGVSADNSGGVIGYRCGGRTWSFRDYSRTVQVKCWSRRCQMRFAARNGLHTSIA